MKAFCAKIVSWSMICRHYDKTSVCKRPQLAEVRLGRDALFSLVEEVETILDKQVHNTLRDRCFSPPVTGHQVPGVSHK